MIKFRRALFAILTLVGLTAISLGTGSVSAVVPPSAVNITATSACVPGGWKVDYTANSVNSALPWKNMTVGWLPTVNTYQANTIPFTRSTGVLPLSQPSTLSVSITVVWTDQATASDTEPQINQPECDVAPTTTTTPPSDTIIVDLTNPPTTASPDTSLVPISAVDDEPCVTDELCFEGAPTTVAGVTDFPVTGNGDGGLIIGGILVAVGAGVTLITRRKPKHA